MNTGSIFHIPEDLLEEYALGKASDGDCSPLDEHLLICRTCQNRLAEIDEYVRVMKAAIAAPPIRASKRSPSRRLSRLQSNALTT